MKKYIISGLALILSVSIMIFIGCSGNKEGTQTLKADADSPDEVVEEFLDYCFSNNRHKAEELVESMYGADVTVGNVLELISRLGFQSYIVGNETIIGEKAYVKVSMKGEEKSETFDITLYVKDGEWKVYASDLVQDMNSAWLEPSEDIGYGADSDKTSNAVDTSGAYSDGYSDGYRKGMYEFEHALENMSGGRPAINPGTGGYSTSAEISAYEDGFWAGYEAGVEAAADAEDAGNW